MVSALSGESKLGGGGGGVGDSQMKGAGMLVGNIELNPQRIPIWAWPSLFDLFLVLLVYMLWFNFILGSNFIFLCFGDMVMYANEFKTKEIKI